MSRIFNVNINFSTSGTSSASSSITSIAKVAQQAERAVFNLRNAMAAIGAYALLRGVGELSQSILDVRNRLSLISKDVPEQIALFARLGQVAQQTRNSFEATADIFARFSLATRDFGTTQQDVLNVVKSINQAVILSGANARESEAALLQLSQGLASDRLAGDELRAVLEQLPFVADVIGKELGVTRGALRFLAKEGKIHADTVLNAFKHSAEEINASFQKTVPTVEQSFVNLKNKALEFLDGFDRKNNILSRFSEFITVLGKNVELLGRLSVIGITTGAVMAALVTAAIALGAIITAVVLDPLLLIPVAIAAAGTALVALATTLVTFGDKLEFPFIGEIADGKFVTGLDIILGFVDSIKDGVDYILGAASVQIPAALQKILGDGENLLNIVYGLGKFLDFFIRAGAGLTGGLIKSFSSFIDIVGFFFSHFSTLVVAGIKSAWNGALTFIETTLKVLVTGFVTLFSSLGTTLAESIEAAFSFRDFDFVGQFTKNLKEQFSTVKGTLDSVDLFGFLKTSHTPEELFTVLQFGGLIKKFGKEFTKGMQDALDFVGNPVTSFLDRGFGKAIENAKKRIANEKLYEARFDTLLGDRRDPSGLKSLRTVVFENLVDNLGAEAGSIQPSHRDNEIATDLAKVIDKFRTQGFTASPDEVKTLGALIQSKFVFRDLSQAIDGYQKQLLGFPGVQDAVNKKLDEATKFASDLFEKESQGLLTTQQVTSAVEEYAKQLDVTGQVMKDIYGPALDYERAIKAITEASKFATTESERLKLQIAEQQAVLQKFANDPTPYAGIQRGLATIGIEITNVGQLYENALVNAFHNAEDALVEFTQTGAFNFSKLAQSILADLERIAIRQFILGPVLQGLGVGGASGTSGGGPSGAFSFLGRALGGLGGALGDIFSSPSYSVPGGSINAFTGQLTVPEGTPLVTQLNPVEGFRALGGPVTPGSSYMVGENGPERFVPSSSGSIVPAGATGPTVNVNINVNKPMNPQEFGRTVPQLAREAASQVKRFS